MENTRDERGRRSVSLRAERTGDDSRYLDATVTEDGDLRLAGQDLGPNASPTGRDGEYEWVTTVPAEHLPALLRALDAPEDADVLDELAARWTGPASHEFERRIREAGIPVEFWNY